MNPTNARRLFWCTALALAIAAAPVALAQNNDHENPDLYPGSWYKLVLGTDGVMTSGEGDGYNDGTWYYYPQTGWYRQWFYNDPYSADREGYLHYEVYIKAVDNTKLTYAEINFNWTTPEWSQLGLNRPPLPGDVAGLEKETKYMASARVYLVDGWYIGTVEPIYNHIIEEYNPEWISIDIRGRNAYMFRGAVHECRSKKGACINRETGECTLTYEDDCQAPLEWLGPATTCDTDAGDSDGIDFGDAPNSYKTLTASNGARHTKVVGVFLGKTADVESDGQPDSYALGDDSQSTDDEDGIVFTSSLLPGASTTVEVTASTSGYVNAWMDFNRDGDFGESNEQIFSDELVAGGVNELSFRIPATAATGSTYARFRFNTRGLLSWQGLASDGEVEDYMVTLADEFEPQTNSGKGGLKWSQTPQQFDAATPYIFNAWSERSDLTYHQIGADDWECDDDRPVTGFQWWGSFQGWTQPMPPSDLPLAFHVAIWSDAANSGHPATLVWEKYCTNWTWSLAGYSDDPQKTGNDACFQFTCLLSQDQWFKPALSRDKNGDTIATVYWLSIATLYDAGTSAPSYPWGWTTRPLAFNDGAIRIATTSAADKASAAWPPSTGSQWLSGKSVEYPKGTAWDFAFELLTNESSAADDPALAPVYRFWSTSLGAHFYTIDEAEKEMLIAKYSNVWTYEGIAFYAYPPEQAPVGSKPVYRFWSATLNRHFYTISESERQNLIDKYPFVWTPEGIAWYAFE
ncbi:MAG: GEVED domain-containing protein [Solirubrobacterales bacterium]